MEIAFLPRPTSPYPLYPALSMVPRAEPTAVCSRGKHHKTLSTCVCSQGLHNKNILVICANLSQRFVASERQACQVPVGSIFCTSWLLLPNGWSGQQLTGKAEQGEAALAAKYSMMYFCLAPARSEECLWWGKVNAAWLETRQSGPCSGTTKSAGQWLCGGSQTQTLHHSTELRG